MSEQRLMKDSLGSDAVARICHVLTILIADFPAQGFTDDALAGLEDLELKQRVEHIIHILAAYLPSNFVATADILLHVKNHWDWGNDDDALSGFAAWPLIDYVAVYGLEHPELIIQLCQRWIINAGKGRVWIIRHACRTLIKQGEPAVLKLLGFTKVPQISIEKFSVITDQIKLNESLNFSFGLRSSSVSEQYLMIDYKIHYIKKNQVRTSKVFKLKTIKLAANKTVEINKSHPFKQITTRKYYSGIHKLELVLNGKCVGEIDFNLLVTNVEN